MLLLVDGNNVFAVCYFALRSDEGEIKGYAGREMLRYMLRLMNDYTPSHVIIAWDSGRSFRHSLYSEYKANRPPKPDDWSVEFDLGQRMCDRAGFYSIRAQGFEADDVIFTLSQTAGVPVLIFSADRDMLQLVNGERGVMVERLSVRSVGSGASRARSTRRVRYTCEADVQRDLGVLPSQVVDYKALAGDPSDNIPHPPGIGAARARTLLQRYGSLDGVYSADLRSEFVTASGRPYSWVKKLIAGREKAYLGRSLAQMAFVPLVSFSSDNSVAPSGRRVLDTLKGAYEEGFSG